MNSECASYREKIAALVIGDLSDADRRELEAHLDECPHCRMERESFAQTIRLLASAEDEPAPRHFFITPDEEVVSPWRFFMKMRFRLRAAFAGAFIIALFLSGAALSQFHVRLTPEGWAAGFGRGDFDTAALRDELLKAAAEDGLKNGRQLMEEVRNEIARLQEDEDRKTRQLEEVLLRLDSKIDGRVKRSEEEIRQDTQIMAAAMYQELARQRALDIEAITLRLKLAEIREYLNTRQTEEVLLTLLRHTNMNF
jgi:hypothetical protein